MNQTLLIAAAAVCAATCIPSKMSATPVYWALDAVTFTDGGNATGTFELDADTNQILNWDISVAGGNTANFPAFTYDPQDSTATDSVFAGLFLFEDPTTMRELRLQPTTALGDGGGLVSLNLGDPNFNLECYNCGEYRLINSASLVSLAQLATTTAPEPRTIWLAAIGLSLCLVGTLRRRLRARAISAAALSRSPVNRKHGLLRYSALLIPLLGSTPVFAATVLDPIPFTGYNIDGIVEANASTPFSCCARGLDSDGYAFFANGVYDPAEGHPIFTGLPDDGVLNGTTGAFDITFQLGPYGNGSGLSDNLVQLYGGGPETIYLTNPGQFQTLAVLGFATNSSSDAPGDLLLSFSDGSQVFYNSSVSLPDWFSSAPAFFNANGRVSTIDNSFQIPFTGPNLFDSLITLNPDDQQKILTSITFTHFDKLSTNGTGYIAAISGDPSSVPEPASLLLTGSALMFLSVLCRRRKMFQWTKQCPA